MKIGVLGSGIVGKTLAQGFKEVGHDVRIGTRAGNKLADFSAASGVQEDTFSNVAAFADVVILAVKGEIAAAVMHDLADALADKVVIDTTNPIAGPPVDGVVPYFTRAGESLLQRLQAAAPKARVVKAFNAVGAGLMVKPKLAITPSMFICGDKEEARKTVASLCMELGWATEDVGTSAAGHAVEALCQLWLIPGFLRDDWMHAFAMVRG